MAEDTDNSLVPAPNREVTRQTVSLDEIRNCITANGIHIPAGEGRQPVSILPNPIYYRWEHSFNMIDETPDSSVFSTRKSSPVFFAIYLMGIGNPPNEIRSIRLPVQTNGRAREAEDEMIRQMITDGLDAREIAQYTPEHRSKEVVGRAGGTTLRNLFMALKYGHFETSGVDRQLASPAYPEGMRLQSGWAQNDYWPLVIWSNWQAPFEVLFPGENKIDPSGEQIISPPFTQASIETSDSSITKLLKKALQKNQR